jgi:hypothetical protein
MAKLDPPPEGVIRLLHRLLGDDIGTDPEEVREYWTRPEVQLVLAALTGRYGSEQRMLVSDDAGRLQVTPYPGPGVGEARQILVVTRTATVAPSGVEPLVIGVPTGYYGWVRIDGIHIPAPSGASSGTHGIGVYVDLGYAFHGDYTWAYNVDARIASGVPIGASTSIPPASQHIVGGMWYPTGPEDSLIIAYQNDTNVAQTGTRRYILTCRWLQVVEGVWI